MEKEGIQGIIQRMLHVEDQVREVVEGAEGEAKEIIAKSRDEAREFEEKARREAHETVQRELEEAVQRAQDERKARIERALVADATALEERRRKLPEAVRLAVKELAGG